MPDSDWTNVGIALIALTVSIGSAILSWRWRQQDTRTANVTAYFHRTRDYAKIHLPNGEVLPAGYHLVLWNRGPSTAYNLHLAVFTDSRRQVTLLDVAPDEFPLTQLDSGARYPVPWLLQEKELQNGRRFLCRIEWSDDTGTRKTDLPLRRGETYV